MSQMQDFREVICIKQNFLHVLSHTENYTTVLMKQGCLNEKKTKSSVWCYYLHSQIFSSMSLQKVAEYTVLTPPAFILP